MTPGRPRRHHYLPQFYLEGFTATGARDDYLHVLDQRSGKRWKAKVPEVAYEKDLYEIPDDQDTTAMERGFSRIESILAPAVKRVRGKQGISPGDDLAKLLNFVAMMACRVPLELEQIHRPFEQISKAMMRESVMTPERWEDVRASMEADGIDMSNASYDVMKDFVDRDEFDVRADQGTILWTMLEQMGAILPYLFARTWSLAVAPQGGPSFICSDRPVSLIWTSDPVPGWRSPGFGLPNTMVAMPISKDVGLLGTFEGPAALGPMDSLNIATVNSLTGSGGRYVFGPSAEFAWLMKSGAIGNAEDFIKAARSGIPNDCR